ncbi:MAG TPA: amidohydrolase family protein [Methylomirabilota bacterium]|jgi:predicted TIM-barrel fold metal-dependent hydrolase|nr:amidohydrolase family protein [Methylomirabilota bacterium]
MARGGYRIFDADTHIIEPVEPIEAYLSAAEKTALAALGPLVGRGPAKAGMSRYLIGKRPKLDRRLGSRERVAPPTGAARGARDGGTPWDVRWQGPPFPSDRVSFDPHARVKDMDLEGVDVNMVLPSGGVPSFSGLEDIALEQAMYRAYHRFVADYCAPYPDRLTSLVLVSARDAEASVAEIRRCSADDWPVGIFPICPPELSLDDPAWEPIWAAAQEHDLTVVIHSFTMTVPYPPGTWDTWDNVFIQRAAGHVWNAQRNMAALIGAGVLDRYPQLRLTSLECGHGWLAFWASRLDELAEMARHALPPLARKPSEYIRGPQYFQSIQLHEGELSLRQAIEALGEDTLMFATDYPHSESWFPKSVEAVLAWTSIGERARRKLLWENAARCYRRLASRQAQRSGLPAAGRA